MVKTFSRRWTIPAILFLVIGFFWISLSQSKGKSRLQPVQNFQISAEEKTVLTEFFQDLLFEHMGAYVLFGSKPMSISCITQPLIGEEIEKNRKYYESLSEEERAKIVTKDRRYDYPENFRRWEQIRSRFNITQYLFGRFPSLFDETTELLFFVNVEMATRILIECYEDFRRVLGFDFDPLQVVFEVEDKTSRFWAEVLKNHALIGILLGYGRSNAWFFEYEMKHKNDKNKIGDFFRSIIVNFSENRDIRYPDKNEFMLPIFRRHGRYPGDEELIERYKKEYAEINGIYKGNDEVDVALTWLTR